MKALLCNAVGSIDAAVVGEVPEPTLRMREVLVRIHACALNFPDVLMIEGKYQRRPPLPFTPGCEFSGIVESVGADANGFNPGDRVRATVAYGALAEKLAVSVEDLALLPDAVDLDEAAALLFTYATSLYALRDRGALAAGNSLLVLGAGGGVGVAAVELGKALGARVVAAASSESKLGLARSKGADLGVRYPLDMRGKPHQKEFADRLKAAAGGLPSIPLNLPLLKGCQIVGAVWGTATRRDPRLKVRIHRELIDLLAQGRIRPHIHCRFELDRARDGLKMLAERRGTDPPIQDLARSGRTAFCRSVDGGFPSSPQDACSIRRRAPSMSRCAAGPAGDARIPGTEDSQFRGDAGCVRTSSGPMNGVLYLPLAWK